MCISFVSCSAVDSFQNNYQYVGLFPAIVLYYYSDWLSCYPQNIWYSIDYLFLCCHVCKLQSNSVALHSALMGKFNTCMEDLFMALVDIFSCLEWGVVRINENHCSMETHSLYIWCAFLAESNVSTSYCTLCDNICLNFPSVTGTTLFKVHAFCFTYCGTFMVVTIVPAQTSVGGSLLIYTKQVSCKSALDADICKGLLGTYTRQV